MVSDAAKVNLAQVLASSMVCDKARVKLAKALATSRCNEQRKKLHHYKPTYLLPIIINLRPTYLLLCERCEGFLIQAIFRQQMRQRGSVVV